MYWRLTPVWTMYHYGFLSEVLLELDAESLETFFRDLDTEHRAVFHALAVADMEVSMTEEDTFLHRVIADYASTTDDYKNGTNDTGQYSLKQINIEKNAR